MSDSDVTTILFTHRPERVPWATAKLKDERYLWYHRPGVTSFSQIINECVQASPTPIVVLMSDKVQPMPVDIERIVNELRSGYAFVGGWCWAFFATWKWTFQQVGAMDERFIPSTWEDFDYLRRIRERGLAFSVHQNVKYDPIPSSWKKNEQAEEHWNQKWQTTGGAVKRMLKEEPHPYDFSFRANTPPSLKTVSLVSDIQIDEDRLRALSTERFAFHVPV